MAATEIPSATSNTSPAGPICRGTPRFGDAALAAIAARDGAQAAWRHVVASGTEAAMRAAAATGGAFSVGLCDERGSAFLAVDRFAIETLCYRIVDGVLHMAPRADTLAAIAPTADLDPQALYDYLVFHVIPSPRTVFRGVHRLPPGHCAWFKGGKLTVQRYWTPEFEEPRGADFGTLRTAFRDHLRAAVQVELDGSKPACFLSGGTDSSTVAGMIREVTGGPAATYSIGFEAQGYDEMAYARLAARHFGAEHHEYYVTPADLVQHIPKVARHYDQPFGNSSALPAYCCAAMARDDGVTKLLAGDGGDELFGGNERYAKQRLFGAYDRLPALLRHGLLEPALTRTSLGGWPLLRKGRSYIEQARVPMPDRLQMYNLLHRLGPADVLTPEFLAQVDQALPLAHQRETWQAVPKASPVNRMLAYDWRYTLAEADLPKVVGTTGLASVGVGFPMLDIGLVDFSLSLPRSYKLRGLKLRWFFKEALRGFLPDEILTKKKQGFGLPFGVWANQHDDLRALASDSLDSLAQRGVVRPAFVHSLLTQRLQEHPGYYGEMVWILMMLEQWLRGHTQDWRL